MSGNFKLPTGDAQKAAGLIGSAGTEYRSGHYEIALTRLRLAYLHMSRVQTEVARLIEEIEQANSQEKS